VSDPSGVIPGATVVAKDNQTGKERTVVASDSGTFSIAQLDVGTYTVTVTSAGHKTFTVTDVKIDVNKDYTLNASMEVGSISENVTVVGGADVINATDAQLNTTVSSRQIVELPLNGRNPLSLVLLQPGTSSNSAQNTTINGQRSSFTNITRDGINVQDNFIRANAVDFLPDRPNVDDTGEFTIVTQNAGAESGYGSSQVQLVTPRGGNDFHGALYEYNRNSAYAANTYFNNAAGRFVATDDAVIRGLKQVGDPKLPRPFLNRNQLGGKIGGRIIKDKVFFFGAYEAFRQRNSATVARTILSDNARKGILTFQDNSGVVRTVNLFAAPFSTITGVSGINSVIQNRILANLPTGTNASRGDRFNTVGLDVSRQGNQDRDGYTSRFDYVMSNRNSFNGVYSFKKELLLRNDVDLEQGAGACCYTATPFGFQDAHTKFLSVAWNWTPSANLTNELRGGGQKSDPTFDKTAETPEFYMIVPLINNPETSFDAQGRATDIFNLQDNAVWTRGSHSIRFGGQFQGFRADPFGPGAGGQSYVRTLSLGGGLTPTFGTGLTGNFNTALGCNASTGVNCASDAFINTASSLASLLGGLVGSVSQTFNADSASAAALSAAPPLRKLRYENYSFYVADQWRATPHLSLNFGVRYELYSPIREDNGLVLEPVFGGRDVRTAVLDPNGTYNFVGTNAGGHDFFKWDKNNFAPIVSFAWSPQFKNKFLGTLMPGEGRTVIRGGYRMSYVNDEFIRAADNALIGNAGLSSSLTTGSINSTIAGAPTIAAPALVVPRTYAQNNAQAANFGTVFAINPDLSVPKTNEFNIGFEREVGFQTAIEVRYVHGQSSNLVRGLDLNQVNIFNNGFLADFNRARNNISLYGNANVNCTVATATPQCQPLQLLNTTALFRSPAIGATQNTLQFTNTLNPIRAGDVGQLAFVYLSTFRVGNSILLNNPNTGVVDLLTNSARYNYNSLQMEIRRRFSKGLTFQANYTFQKSLTDAPGTGQTRFEPLIDNGLGADLEYAIADSDTTHVFNLNAIYELPFGRGKHFFGDIGTGLDRLLGGWQITSIIRTDSGAPFSITDPRGSLNRAGRSGRQTANTNLTKDQVKALVGTFRTPCGVFFIDPQVINIDLAQCQNGVVAPRVAGTTAGVASLGYDPIGLAGNVKTFPGQVFFSVAPGQTGNMERNFLSGPTYFNWDASIIKNIKITERVRFQIRGEGFNLLNRTNFAITNQFTQANITSSTFGQLRSAFSNRIVQFVGRIEF